VIVDWTDEFDRWLTHAEEQGERLLAVATALLQELNSLPAKPAEESATFKRVQQARRHELWRVAHPFDRPSRSGSSAGSLATRRS
jgi:hypothetical protein